MPYGLQLAVFPEIEESVDSCAHGYASGVIVRSPESAEGLALYVFHASCVRIIFLVGPAEEPVHAIAYRRRDIDIFEQGEIGQANLEIMAHAILELVQETRLVELRSLEAYLVLQGGVITEREFLIELLLADSVLLLEGIEPADRECYVRKGECI